MSRNLLLRVTVAAVGIPVAVGVVYLGEWWLAILVAAFGVLGALEFYRLALAGGVRPLTAVGLVGAAAVPIASYTILSDTFEGSLSWVVYGIAAWLLAVAGVAAARRLPGERPLEAVGVTVFGALYAGGLPAFLLLLRHAPGAPSRWAATALVFLPLVVTWVGDTVAMGAGYALRGPKLAPVLSPNKTWSGAVAGGLSAIVLAPLYGALVLRPLGVEIAAWQLGLLGLAVSVLGQSGDVTESLFKRQMGVKDSGGFFPGHGGVLDRLDALYWAVPSAALLLTWYGVL